MPSISMLQFVCCFIELSCYSTVAGGDATAKAASNALAVGDNAKADAIANSAATSYGGNALARSDANALAVGNNAAANANANSAAKSYGGDATATSNANALAVGGRRLL